MAATKRNDPIRSWEAGDTVSGFALLTKLERRQDKNGKDFIDLELADASGAISAKVWSDSPAIEGGYELHQFVAFKGSVKSYKEQLQISIHDCRAVREGDRQHGFDEALLIPSTHEDIDELWSRLEEILHRQVRRPELRRLAAETLAAHREPLRVHPAAKTIHHAYRGGLLEHMVSMAELALAVSERYPELDRDLLLIGVLFHDLGKLIEIGAMPANDYTPAGRLVGHVVMGRDLLRQGCEAIDGFPADLLLHLEHLVLSHQGRLEYGSPVQPMTAEAIALHFIDNLDSKLAQLRQLSAAATGFQYVRGLGRYVLLPEPRDDADGEAAEDPEGAPAQLELG